VLCLWRFLQLAIVLLYCSSHSVQGPLSSLLLSGNIKSRYTELWFSLQFYMGVNIGLSHRGRKVGWMVLENKVLRKIFGPKGDEVGGRVEKITCRGPSWCVVLTKYYLSDGIKKNVMGEACGTCGTPYQSIRHAYTHTTVLRLTIGWHSQLLLMGRINIEWRGEMILIFFSSSVKFEAGRYALR